MVQEATELEIVPRLLVCDTDALIQIFIAQQGELLKKLKRIYGIQPVITESVEDELFRPRQRKASHFQAKAQKALDNQALIILDERSIGAFTSNDRHTTYNSIQLIGQKNNVAIGRGEAFSHAAGVVLRAPVLSNDTRAVEIADRRDLQVAENVLRAYDLFVLFHQIGQLTEDGCDEIRQLLTAAQETPPYAFRNRKFKDGLPYFCPRVVDGDFPKLATGQPTELPDQRCLIVRSQTVPKMSLAASSSRATPAEVSPTERPDPNSQISE